jgi:ClpP class serine protease
MHVDRMIDKIPQNKNKIVVLINSEGGCLAQTQIIIKKIAHLAAKNKAEVWTFGQEYALNAGFMILACGDRVYIDQTTVVGGI